MGVQVLHYRDHHNGGKFDGDCYIDTGKNYYNSAIRIRFKITEFDSGFQYLWGVGSGNNQYSLKLVRDTNDYYLRVTYLDVDYDFTDYRIGISEMNHIYNASIYLITSPSTTLVLKVSKQYGKDSVVLTKANTSDESSYVIPKLHVYLGATSELEEGSEICVDGGFPNSDNWEEHGNWVIAGGVATHSAGQVSELYQRDIITQTAVYKSTFTIKNWIAGIVKLKVDSDAGVNREANGTYTRYYNVVPSNEDIEFEASTLADLEIDDVSIKILTTSGASENKFTGIIYDFETYYATGGTDCQRLVFYEKYDSGVSSDVVYDGENSNDATITDRPSDFWSSETDISDFIYRKYPMVCKYRQDKFRVTEFPSLDFKLFDYFDVAAGDTIGIKIDDELCWLFNIYKTKKTDDGNCLLVKCEDFLMNLQYVNAMTYVSRHYSVYNVHDIKWWSNYVVSDHEWIEAGTPIIYEDSFISLFYILKQAIYLLQYDNILTVDVSDLTGEDSPYKEYPAETYLDYDYLCYAWIMFRQLNRIEYPAWTEPQTAIASKMNGILREIMLSVRITFFIKNSVLYFYRIASGNETIPDDDVRKTEPEEIVTNRKYHEIAVNVCTEWAIEDLSDDTILYDPVTGSEVWKLITRDDARIWQKKVDGVWVDYDTWD